MPTQQYIHTVFESLETAVEYGMIGDWSVDGPNIAIRCGSERTTIPQLDAADYLIHLFEEHEMECGEARLIGAHEEAAR